MIIQVNVIDISAIKEELLEHPIIINTYQKTDMSSTLIKEHILEKILNTAITIYIRQHYIANISNTGYEDIWIHSPYFDSLYNVLKDFLNNNLKFDLKGYLFNYAYIETIILNDNLHIIFKGKVEDF